MDRFQLVTDMTPKGDQPQAIDALTYGLQVGEKFQTLVGVTGSGKSLPPEELVWVYGPDGPALTPIGPFIDRLMQEGRVQQSTHETETLFLPDHSPYSTLSLNPATLQPQLMPISAVHRHTAPSMLWTIETSCGRSICITGDHNLWVLRNGQLVLCETHDVKLGDHLPLPLHLPTKESSPSHIPTSVALDNGREVFVDAGEKFSSTNGTDLWRLGKLLSPHDPNAGYRKLFRVKTRGERLSLAATQTLESHGIALTTPQAAVGTRQGTVQMPLSLPLTKQLLEVLGLFIAEGHAEDRYFMISCDESELKIRLEQSLDQLGLKWFVRKNGYDYVISSKLYTKLFAAWCGRNARTKRLPPFWPQLSTDQLGILLAAYFSGDGGVEHGRVTVTTASHNLASELCYALTRFTLCPRVSKRIKRATNSFRHRGDLYYQLSISGAEELTRFGQTINFLLTRKRKALERQLGKHAHTNVDVIPAQGTALKQLRIRLRLTQEALANQLSCARSLLSLIESGMRRPSRAMFKQLMTVLHQEAVQQRDREAVGLIEKLERLAAVRWSPVRSVTRTPSHCRWVYDFSVRQNETFLAGFGGLFVHNTYTIANVIERINRPTLLISHNKTLAAQLYSELKSFFPHNAVEYFVSYYDYYQPEAYVPPTDTYIEKDADINEDLDRLRLSATTSLMSRRDVVIVASVSCIYNLGDPEEYRELMVWLSTGAEARRDEVLSWLVGIHYTRNDVAFARGTFRVRGDTIDVFPAYRQTAYRIELDGDRITRLREIHPLTNDTISDLEQIAVYPAKHFVTTKNRILHAAESIQRELIESVRNLQGAGKLLEAQRLQSRTSYDLEMLKEVGFCHGVENYSRHLSGRPPGSRPYSLIDYFPDDFLTVIDESHVTIPQIGGMFEGDRARKTILVEYGFRLPSALDNRPQTFEEFEGLIKQAIFVSATPGPYELKKSKGHTVEQIIRPTGLVDPTVIIKPTQGQIDDLIEQVRRRAERKERVLVTTLTKRMSEDLSRYLADAGLRVTYLHSEIDAIGRVQILKQLREGAFDCLIGINLLREGLDLPEVSLVAVLDADKEGFLRSATSLIQVAGRAARNVNGEVILYADQITGAMRVLMGETNRRRSKQLDYNREHGITPTTVRKAIRESIEGVREAEELAVRQTGQSVEEHQRQAVISEMEEEMLQCARGLQFERAALLRDQIRLLKEQAPESERVTYPRPRHGRAKRRA